MKCGLSALLAEQCSTKADDIMRKNFPTTDTEYVLEDGRPIVSKTDLKGRITYVNPYFVEVSGFEESELIGAPHNIVRHPDMPPAAFGDLWNTLGQGELWSAPVKNRRKNGDFYWVLANVTPITESGQVVGYMSVRTRPSAQQIEAATRAYAEMRKGDQSKVTVIKGNIENKNFLSSLFGKLRTSAKGQLAMLGTSHLALMALLPAWEFAAGSTSPLPGGLPWIFLSAALINLYCLWFAYDKLMRPIAAATGLAQSLAGGDLAAQQSVATRSAATGQLFRALEQLQVNLVAAIGDIRDNMSAMNSATRDIAAGNMDLSSRTEAQAASLEETASSMEEFASTVSNNASNAQDATRLADDATAIAAKGGADVAAVGRTMNEISSASKHVADIVGVIDGIAFQTNILALNAAVEAARAGESGRGFAVVASEVRSLAQRSASAAKEIKTLIADSMHKVEAGNQLVAAAEGTMSKVVEVVSQVNGTVTQIAMASKEQAIGVQQVNQAVSEMDRITQHNAALVEEAAAAASSLHREAELLSHAVAVFNLPRVTHPSKTQPVRAIRKDDALPANTMPAEPKLLKRA